MKDFLGYLIFTAVVTGMVILGGYLDNIEKASVRQFELDKLKLQNGCSK